MLFDAHRVKKEIPRKVNTLSPFSFKKGEIAGEIARYHSWIFCLNIINYRYGNFWSLDWGFKRRTEQNETIAEKEIYESHADNVFMT